jgi:antitoxin (DNA-binding transcriptional repressor) of toxin-antitoxin stability system
MATTINIRDLSARFEEAVEVATLGGEVILTDGATTRARLVPCVQPSERVPGLHDGAIVTAPDFDFPLPDDFWAGQP